MSLPKEQDVTRNPLPVASTPELTSRNRKSTRAKARPVKQASNTAPPVAVAPPPLPSPTASSEQAPSQPRPPNASSPSSSPEALLPQWERLDSATPTPALAVSWPNTQMPTVSVTVEMMGPEKTQRPTDGTTAVSGTQKALAKPQRSLDGLLKLVKPGCQSTTPPAQAKKRTLTGSNVALVVCIAFIAMTTVVTVFLVAGGFRKRGYVASPMCESFACSAHARELNIGNSKGTGPCEDFGEFVCTAWGEKHAQTQQTVAGVRIADWLKRLGPALAIVDPEHPIATRAKSMLTACLTGTGGHAGSDNEALLEVLVFMSEVAFPWLTDASDVLLGAPDDYSKPLGTIVNLSVTWNMPLWFHVDLRLLHGWSFRHRSVSISPSFYCLWERVHANILKYQGFYGGVVRRYFEQVFSAKKIAPTFQTFVSNSATMQSDVLAKLKHILKATHPLPKLVEIRDLPRIVPQVDDHQWVDALQVAFKADPPLSASDTLFATNGDVLDSLRDIFWSYSARNVTMYTAWYFAQVMASVVSNRIRADIRDHPEGAAFIKMMCATQVMDVYNSLVASINGWGLHAELRPLVYKHLNNVHEVALQAVRKWTVLNSRSLDAIASRFQCMGTVIWNEGRYGTQEGLTSLYGQSFNTTLGFFGHWLESRRRLRVSMGSDGYQVALRVFRTETDQLTFYNAISNSLTMSLAALEAPYYYYPGGTSSMIYGGLAFVYAVQVAEALNALTWLVRDGVTPSPWKPRNAAVNASTNDSLTVANNTDDSESSGLALWDLARCPAPTDAKLAFPLLPALEIAHTAYVQFRNESQDLRLKDLPSYSAEQVFFLTACHVTCSKEDSGPSSSPICTAAMRNFEPFARAFSCRAGSPMNPENKCQFFSTSNFSQDLNPRRCQADYLQPQRLIALE